MPSTHTGHFVQVFKELGPYGYHKYVTVEGRSTAMTVSVYPGGPDEGWFFISRELPRKKAVKYAKAYRNAGLRSRVVFRGNDGKQVVTDEFDVKR